MSAKSSIIVINGRHYDAETGQALHGRGTHPRHTTPHTAKPRSDPGHSTPQAVASRHRGHHAARHTPKPSRTLMRQTVKKPQPALKRRIKVQGQLSRTHERHTRPAAKLRRQSSRQGTSQLISHFSPELFTVTGYVEPQPAKETPSAPRASARKTAIRPHKKPLTTAELLDYIVQQAPLPQEPAHKSSRKLLKRHRHHSAAV